LSDLHDMGYTPRIQQAQIKKKPKSGKRKRGDDLRSEDEDGNMLPFGLDIIEICAARGGRR